MSLKEIALMTSTSVSTVSRVLNNSSPACASKEVRDRIWAAAHETGYIPNPHARSLKKGSPSAGAYHIAVVLARINSLEGDPFFAELFRCLETELFSRNMLLSAVTCADSPPDFGSMKADGIVILGRCSEKLLSALRAVTPNLVGIWRNMQNFSIDEIVCDGKKAAAAAMEYLISLGHQKIAYIGDCSYESRYVGYCEALISHQLPIDYGIILPTNQTEREGEDAVKALPADAGATAVLCANDSTAIGVLKAMKKLKIKDTAVISIDNIEEAYSTDPPLTTVNIPREDMAHMAAEVLYDRIRRGHREFLRIEFPCRIIRRESCLPGRPK